MSLKPISFFFLCLSLFSWFESYYVLSLKNYHWKMLLSCWKFAVNLKVKYFYKINFRVFKSLNYLVAQLNYNFDQFLLCPWIYGTQSVKVPRRKFSRCIFINKGFQFNITVLGRDVNALLPNSSITIESKKNDL